MEICRPAWSFVAVWTGVRSGGSEVSWWGRPSNRLKSFSQLPKPYAILYSFAKGENPPEVRVPHFNGQKGRGISSNDHIQIDRADQSLRGHLP